MVSVSTQTTAARIAARRAAEPNRCSDCCSAEATIDSRLVSATWGPNCGVDFGLVVPASETRGCRRAGVVLFGRPAGDRRLGSGRFASGTGYLASTEKRGNAKSPAYRA